MPIKDSVETARKRGVNDYQILQEIIKQNPEKGEYLYQAFLKGESPTIILEKLIKQGMPKTEKPAAVPVAQKITPQEDIPQEEPQTTELQAKENPKIEATKKILEARIKSEKKAPVWPAPKTAESSQKKNIGQASAPEIKQPPKKVMPSNEELMIQEAMKRIEALKKSGAAKPAPETPAPAKTEQPKPVAIKQAFENINIKSEEEQKEIEQEKIASKQEADFEKFATPVKEQQQEIKKKEEVLVKFLQKNRPAPASAPVVPVPPIPSTSKPAPPPSQIIRPVPQKPSARQQLWVRAIIFILVIVLLAGVSTFWYWYFVIRVTPPAITPNICTSNENCEAGKICSGGVCIENNQVAAVQCATSQDCAEGQVCDVTGICIPKPASAPAPSQPLFAVDDTRTLTIASPSDLNSALGKVIQESIDNGLFRRIVVINTTENQVLTLKDFFAALLLRMPDEFFQKVGKTFTLFSYSQPEGNRVGIATEIIDQEGLSSLLSSEENNMMTDFEPLYDLMGKTGAPLSTYFRDATNVSGYTGPNFRFQTVNNKDLGIIYMVSDNYFILASSWQGMQKTIAKLNINSAPVALTQDLKKGDKGPQVQLLQTWLKQDSTVYSAGLTTGTFGSMTKTAVIAFQEKYASETLTPRGLIHGDGIVELYTRTKLNELYGKSGIFVPATELTTDLRFGTQGSEVTLLQTWLKKDSDVYPQGTVSGYFGYLTQAAVKRFQQKYASEILTPEGLTTGSGIVDALTRKKLNELYGGK